ncbi:Diacylglycerol O-acyltransferase [Mycolicibacterium chubuense NBB4]|uniref:Diacylglycerol O-acyltransferase n=1 Tax=Mycolicibacterium chubuense (strain NBB4) TaxID=710421 RepID=I4BEY8_MYCCN|nr:wax ester/triacylglycerol synthase family O-acyltransferase [Mycolicibacterium chubuense]AFM15845.1 Diacylglycerol O-acyltransferase [Mycolicibacterium chubuense NBB4]
MERLSAFDAGFLQAEDADRHVSLAVGAVSVLEGPMPDFAELVAGMGERLLRIPRFRQVVRPQPFDIGAPAWVDDPDFDLSHHVHFAALPHPGDDEALFRFTAEAMEPRLDRERPLWQCWIIEGLAHDRWAMLMKVHHSIGDGIATMHILAGLCDGAAEANGGTYVDAIRAAHEPEPQGFSLPKPTLNPARWAAAARDIATAAVKTVGVTVEGALQIVNGLIRSGGGSPLLGPVSTMRRYSAVHVPMASVETVCQAFDVTINDVALAAITDSFRAALLRRGEQPRHDSLRTLVPVSVRSNDALGTADNRVSLMLPYLPVDKADRVEQLRTVHRRLTRAKAGGQRRAGNAAVAAIKLVPYALSSRTVRTLTGLPQRGVVTLATNVPGPRQQMQMMGRTVLHMYPIPPVALRLRAGVAILSYHDELVFGITTDFDTFPDVDELAFGIKKAVACLVSAARRPGPGRSGLTLLHPSVAYL